MSEDIYRMLRAVERTGAIHSALCGKAADEIERLRAEVSATWRNFIDEQEALRTDNSRLRAELDKLHSDLQKLGEYVGVYAGEDRIVGLRRVIDDLKQSKGCIW